MEERRRERVIKPVSRIEIPDLLVVSQNRGMGGYLKLRELLSYCFIGNRKSLEID